MGILNKIPEGLLSLFDSKADGVNPQQLTESVIPTVDLLAFYQNFPMEIATFSSTYTAINTQLEVVVPAGEIWLIHAVHGSITLVGTGEAASLALRFTGIPNPGSGGVSAQFFKTPELLPFPGGNVAQTAGVLWRIAHFFEKPFTLRAGMGVASLFIDGIVSLPAAGSVFVMYTKLTF